MGSILAPFYLVISKNKITIIEYYILIIFYIEIINKISKIVLYDKLKQTFKFYKSNYIRLT